MGFMPEKWDCEYPVLLNGKSVIEFLDQHRFLLRYAPPTKYYYLIKELQEVHILTAQPKYEWVIFAQAWIEDHFWEGQVKVDYLLTAEDKLSFLSDDAVLFEDSPKLSCYDRVYLIDYPYNRCVEKCLGRITNENEMYLILQKLVEEK